MSIDIKLVLGQILYRRIPELVLGNCSPNAQHVG